jgi:hypothetical protein
MDTIEKLHIVTVCTEKKFYFPYLEESCKRNGLELTVLGLHEKWKGYTWRMELMMEYLKKLPPHDIVCFVDGYDVICTRSLSTLPKDFHRIQKKTSCRLIVGHDKNKKFIIQELCAKMYFGQCKNLSLNAGTYIGKVCDVMHILENITKNMGNEKNDQPLLTQYCQSFEEEIHIDEESELFLTITDPLKEICPMDSLQKENAPYFLHANYCGYMNEILLHLGYELDSEWIGQIKKELHYYHHQKNKDYIKDSIYKLRYLIIVIIFLIPTIIIIKRWRIRTQKS